MHWKNTSERINGLFRGEIQTAIFAEEQPLQSAIKITIVQRAQCQRFPYAYGFHAWETLN